MTDSKEIITNWATGLGMGQWYGLSGIAMAFLSQLGIDANFWGTRITLIAPNEFLAYFSILLLLMGTALHFYRTRKEAEKRG